MAQKQKQLKRFPPLKINRAYLDKLYSQKQDKVEKLKRLTMNRYE